MLAHGVVQPLPSYVGASALQLSNFAAGMAGRPPEPLECSAEPASRPAFPPTPASAPDGPLVEQPSSKSSAPQPNAEVAEGNERQQFFRIRLIAYGESRVALS